MRKPCLDLLAYSPIRLFANFFIYAMASPCRVIIIGGGISGLSAAHRLLEGRTEGRSPVEIRLLEADRRLGGTIRTEARDGFLVEYGPDSFLATKPWGVALCKRIGIDHRIIPTNEAFRRAHIVFRGRLHPIPEGFLMLAPTRFWPFVASRLFSWPGKLRMAMDLVLPRGAPGADETLASFVTRRLGREVLERVVQPLIGGIYTADPETLSLRATMPRFLEMEAEHRSIILAMWKQRRAAAKRAREARRGKRPADGGARYSQLVSFDRGMQTIVDELAGRLPEDTIRLEQAVSSIARHERGWAVEMADGGTETADAVVIATPAYRAAALVRRLDPDLAADLDAIPYASSAIVNLAYRQDDVGHPLDGFGFVVPAAEQRHLIAGSFSSVKFPGRAPEGHALVRAFLGGALQERLFDLDDDALLRAVREDFRELLGIQAAPLFSMISRYPKSMPQYHVGHLQRVERIHARIDRHPGLAVAGNAYEGVGMPDCVHSGEAAADRILKEMTMTPAASST